VRRGASGLVNENGAIERDEVLHEKSAVQ